MVKEEKDLLKENQGNFLLKIKRKKIMQMIKSFQS
jgi:hypothetical protein